MNKFEVKGSEILMETFPLESMTLEEAKNTQFRLVDKITRHFTGTDSFIEFFHSLEYKGLDIINDVGKPHQRIAGMRALSRRHKEKPIKVDDLYREVSVLHVEDIKQSGT